MPALKDVPLPKHVSDSCYAAIIQIYKDMFDLTPKSNLIHYLVNFTKQQAAANAASVNSNTSSRDHHQQIQQKNSSKFLSFGSFKKSTSSVTGGRTDNNKYNDVLTELSDSKDFKRPRKTGNKSGDIRASWHGETNNSRRKQYDTHL